MRLEDSAIALALGLLVLGLAAAEVADRWNPSTWINRDGRFYTNVNETIVDDFSLDQQRYASSWYTGELGWNRNLDAGWSNIAIGRGGVHLPKHPVLMPVLSTPLYLTFGLLGNLMFNLAMFGVLGAAAYRFARAYAPPAAAAVATLGFVLGTGVREYAYDYHVDVLLLALFLGALAALVLRRGALGGALVGLVVILKPTSLMWLPSLGLIAFAFGGKRVLWRALAAGTLVLIAQALFNTVAFGRPWWAGYNRVLVVVDGEPTVTDVGDMFTVPLEEGFMRIWSGRLGVVHRLTLMGLAVPGLVALLPRRRHYVIAAVLAVAASLLVFARYTYEGDRFHWPAAAMLVPALAVTVHLLLRGARRLLRSGRLHRAFRLTRTASPPALAAGAAALIAVAVALASTSQGDVASRLGDTPYVQGASALGAGSLDLRDWNGPAADAAMSRRAVSRSRFGHWIPRTSPASVFLAAPFAAAGGLDGLVLLHLIALGVLAFSGALVLGRFVPWPVAAAAAVGATLLPVVRDAVVTGGPPLLAAAAALGALAAVLRGRWAVAGVLSVLCAWLADAPWLVPFAVGIVALGAERPAIRRTFAAMVVTAGAWGLLHLLWIGRPFASPDEFVLLNMGAQFEAVDLTGDPSLAVTDVLASEGGRFLLPWLPLAALGLLAGAVREPRTALAVAVTGVPMLFLDAGTGLVAFATLAVLSGAVLIGAVSTAMDRWLRRGGRRRLLLAAAVVVGGLLVVGATRRALAANAPFEIASRAAVRNAEVSLGHVPCDFLAWEHYAWECSHLDRGTFGLTGLLTTADVRVGARREELFVISSPSSHRPRRVAWRGLVAGEALYLQWAVPEGHGGGGALEVMVDGETVQRVDVPVGPTGSLHELDVDTSRWKGRAVTLTLALEGDRDGSVIALDGRWRNDSGSL